MTLFIRTVVIALLFILVTAAASICYGFISLGRLTFAFVFKWNFLVGAFFLAVGFIFLILPASFKLDKLIDHTTIAERYYAERHMQKQKKAYGYFYLGLLIMFIAGFIQIFLGWIL